MNGDIKVFLIYTNLQVKTFNCMWIEILRVPESAQVLNVPVSKKLRNPECQMSGGCMMNDRADDMV